MSKKNEHEFILKGLEKAEISFVTKDETGAEKIDIENLETVLDSIKQDAIKANKGNGHAARRFRVNTITLSKSFLDMRKVTVVK